MKPKMGIRTLAVTLALVTPFAITACKDQGADPEIGESALLSVIPPGNAKGIDPSSSIVIEFTHTMMQGMEEFADVHEGHLDGPPVPGSWRWNDDRTHLSFTPNAPLKSQTQYLIHLGGGMQDQNGQAINLQQHGTGMGGQWMTQQMHQGGQHGYGMGQGGMGGMGGGTGMGQGWAHPTNGGYGMIFTFTTA